jgi:hypothetical protein
MNLQMKHQHELVVSVIDFIFRNKYLSLLMINKALVQNHSLIDQFLNGSLVGAKPLSFKNLFQKIQ